MPHESATIPLTHRLRETHPKENKNTREVGVNHDKQEETVALKESRN